MRILFFKLAGHCDDPSALCFGSAKIQRRLEAATLSMVEFIFQHIILNIGTLNFLPSSRSLWLTLS